MRHALLWIGVLALWAVPALAKEGGELGNAFVPFESRIGRFSLEYPKKWSYNDLSNATAFTDTSAGSFFAVVADSGRAARSADELREILERKFPGVTWQSASLAGLSGLEGMVNGVRQIHLLRAPGDLISLKMRSNEGESSDKALSYMLRSFRVE